MTNYGVRTEYDRSAGRKREYLTVWSGPFFSVFEADAVSLPKRDGYMVTTHNGEKIRVACPAPRTDANFQEVDNAITEALCLFGRATAGNNRMVHLIRSASATDYRTMCGIHTPKRPQSTQDQLPKCRRCFG